MRAHVEANPLMVARARFETAATLSTLQIARRRGDPCGRPLTRHAHDWIAKTGHFPGFPCADTMRATTRIAPTAAMLEDAACALPPGDQSSRIISRAARPNGP